MGYDTSIFLNPVHKELICSICFGVFEKPVVLPLCRHVFCSECIKNWMTQQEGIVKVCPIDKTTIKSTKEEVIKKKSSYALHNIICDSIVFCKYKEMGCKKTLSLQAYVEHIKVCKHNPTIEQSTSGPENPSNSEMIVDTTVDTVQAGDQATKQSNNKKSVEKSICGMSHAKQNDSKTYSNPKWQGSKKLVKFTINSIGLSYPPYNIAGYLKHVINIDVHCVHTLIEYESELMKDLAVFVGEDDVTKALKSELWPSEVCIDYHLEYKGSLQKQRGESFYGFGEHNAEKKQRKELRKKRRKEQSNAKSDANEAKKQKNSKNAPEPKTDSVQTVASGKVAKKKGNNSAQEPETASVQTVTSGRVTRKKGNNSTQEPETASVQTVASGRMGEKKGNNSAQEPETASVQTVASGRAAKKKENKKK